MFDPVRVCAILNEEGVDYVVVGGMATVIHGSALATRDVDVVPSRDRDNLDRLGKALDRMNAMIRSADDPVPARLDGPFLAEIPFMLNLVTDFGDVDLTFNPSGELDGFDGWRSHAVLVEIGDGVSVYVGSLDDVIASKRAANRPKDQRDLPYLESLRDQLHD